jgi:hypothetical protein
MAGIIYFVPGVPGVPPEMAERLGIAAAAGGHIAQGQIDSGPGGQAGTLVKASGDQQRLRYDAAGQLWAPVKSQADAGQEAKVLYWLGCDKANPPGPAELARERQLPGRMVTLADGNQWLLPTARLASGGTNLPVRLRLADDGGDCWEIVQACQGLWRLAGEVWGLVVSQVARQAGAEAEGEDWDDQRLIAAACTCLAANYRVGPGEVRLLGLLSTLCVHEILHTLVDWQGYLELLAAGQSKKNGPASGS